MCLQHNLGRMKFLRQTLIVFLKLSWFYLHVFLWQTQGDHFVLHYVARILEMVVPLMDHPSETFLAQLEEDMMKLILKHGMMVNTLSVSPMCKDMSQSYRDINTVSVLIYVKTVFQSKGISWNKLACSMEVLTLCPSFKCVCFRFCVHSFTVSVVGCWELYQLSRCCC